MSVLDWFTRAPGLGDIVQDGGPFWWRGTGYAGPTKSGVRVDQDSAMTCSAVAAATSAIAETLASLPAIVYETMSERERHRALEDPLYRLLHDQPNPEMDSFTFYEMGTMRLVNRGNCFAEIERSNADEPIALWPIHNSRVKPWRLPDGELEYHIVLNDNRRVAVPERDMLNVVGRWSEDGITAPGVIPRGAESIGANIAAERYGASFFGSGARPPGVLEHPGAIRDPNIRTQMRREWNEVHQGEENWQNIAILWENVKYKEIGVSPEQAQFLQTRRFNSVIISQWYGVSPAILQDYADSKFATVEAQLKHFIMLSIRPWAVRWERAIGRQLFKFGPTMLEFLLNALLRGDPKTQAETNGIKVMHGALNQDEWRAQDNDNPLPDGSGQHYYMPLNVAPIEHVIDGTARKQAQSSRAPAPAAAAVATSGASLNSAYARRVLDEAYSRMVGKEINAANRAATKPAEFLTWLNNYYGSFAAKLAEAIQTGVEGCLAEHDLPAAAAQAFSQAIANEHVEQSRRAMLLASECQPNELVAAVKLCTESWDERRPSLDQFLTTKEPTK